MRTRPLLLLSLGLLLACGGAPDRPADDLELDTSTLRKGKCPVCGMWKATGLTINGVQDPLMDPTGKVVFTVRPDSSFTLMDATEGGNEEWTGKWTVDIDGILTLTDTISDEGFGFRIRELNAASMILQVMEEEEQEVLLHYRAGE